MSLEVKGTIKVIGQVQYISQSFSKQELVVTTEEQYKQDILIEFHNDNTDKLHGFHPGQQVTVGINLRGKEHTNNQGQKRYYNTIVGWWIK